jgi:hypothetical protein
VCAPPRISTGTWHWLPVWLVGSLRCRSALHWLHASPMGQPSENASSLAEARAAARRNCTRVAATGRLALEQSPTSCRIRGGLTHPPPSPPGRTPLDRMGGVCPPLSFRRKCERKPGRGKGGGVLFPRRGVVEVGQRNSPADVPMDCRRNGRQTVLVLVGPQGVLTRVGAHSGDFGSVGSKGGAGDPRLAHTTRQPPLTAEAHTSE